MPFTSGWCPLLFGVVVVVVPPFNGTPFTLYPFACPTPPPPFIAPPPTGPPFMLWPDSDADVGPGPGAYVPVDPPVDANQPAMSPKSWLLQLSNPLASCVWSRKIQSWPSRMSWSTPPKSCEGDAPVELMPSRDWRAWVDAGVAGVWAWAWFGVVWLSGSEGWRCRRV